MAHSTKAYMLAHEAQFDDHWIPARQAELLGKAGFVPASKITDVKHAKPEGFDESFESRRAACTFFPFLWQEWVFGGGGNTLSHASWSFLVFPLSRRHLANFQIRAAAFFHLGKLRRLMQSQWTQFVTPVTGHATYADMIEDLAKLL